MEIKLDEQIKDLRVHCIFGTKDEKGKMIVDTKGCPEVVSLNELQKHIVFYSFHEFIISFHQRIHTHTPIFTSFYS